MRRVGVRTSLNGIPTGLHIPKICEKTRSDKKFRHLAARRQWRGAENVYEVGPYDRYNGAKQGLPKNGPKGK